MNTPKPAKISLALRKKYNGYIAISFDGKLLGVGKDSVKALEAAKQEMPDIEAKEFLVSRIHHDDLLTV